MKRRLRRAALDIDEVLRRADAGERVDAIAKALDRSPGTIYTVLRGERPARERSPRTRTSTLPPRVQALLAAGVSPARTAELLNITRAYVYKLASPSE